MAVLVRGQMIESVTPLDAVQLPNAARQRFVEAWPGLVMQRGRIAKQLVPAA